jgi:hypothetical protein
MSTHNPPDTIGQEPTLVTSRMDPMLTTRQDLMHSGFRRQEQSLVASSPPIFKRLPSFLRDISAGQLLPATRPMNLADVSPTCS